MQLDKFIEESILQILNGIGAAQEKKTKGTINPNVRAVVREKIQNVKFDIAVTVDETIATDAAAKINVLGVNLGAGVEGNKLSGSVSRISFEVPLIYPVCESPE